MTRTRSLRVRQCRAAGLRPGGVGLVSDVVLIGRLAWCGLCCWAPRVPVRHAASAIAEQFGVPAISTGEMFRAEAGRGTPLGRRVAPLLNAGSLVPDDVAVAVVR